MHGLICPRGLDRQNKSDVIIINRTHIFRQQLKSNSNHKEHNSNHESVDCELQLACNSKLLDAHCDHKVKP